MAWLEVDELAVGLVVGDCRVVLVVDDEVVADPAADEVVAVVAVDAESEAALVVEVPDPVEAVVEAVEASRGRVVWLGRQGREHADPGKRSRRDHTGDGATAAQPHVTNGASRHGSIYRVQTENKLSAGSICRYK